MAATATTTIADAAITTTAADAAAKIRSLNPCSSEQGGLRGKLQGFPRCLLYADVQALCNISNKISNRKNKIIEKVSF